MLFKTNLMKCILRMSASFLPYIFLNLKHVGGTEVSAWMRRDCALFIVFVVRVAYLSFQANAECLYGLQAFIRNDLTHPSIEERYSV